MKSCIHKEAILGDQSRMNSVILGSAKEDATLFVALLYVVNQ